MEAEKQLSDKTIYKDVTFNKNIIPNLTEKSNKIFENLIFENLILKTLTVWENYIFSLKFINGYWTYLRSLW